MRTEDFIHFLIALSSLALNLGPDKLFQKFINIIEIFTHKCGDVYFWSIMLVYYHDILTLYRRYKLMFIKLKLLKVSMCVKHIVSPILPLFVKMISIMAIA